MAATGFDSTSTAKARGDEREILRLASLAQDGDPHRIAESTASGRRSRAELFVAAKAATYKALVK